MGHYKAETIHATRALVGNIGVDATATKLGISRETVRRRMRNQPTADKCKPKKETVATKSALIDSIEKRFSKRELQAISTGGMCSQKIIKPRFQQTSGTFILGVLSDTHFGSVFTAPGMVYSAFEEFRRAGVDAVVIAGDITEGMTQRAGHVFELTHVGFKSQLEHSVSVLSQWTDSPIYLIDGNHDRWYSTAVGAHIVPAICEQIQNAHFLGHDEGDIKIGAATIKLWHGEDGSSYAFSYRIQKLVEAFTGGEKPNVLICGHTHKAMYVFDRHVHCLSAGAVQRQSKWMRSKRHASHTGFWIAEIGLSTGGVSSFTPTWYPAYI